MFKKVQWRSPAEGRMTVLAAGDFCPRLENSTFIEENADRITAGIKPLFDEADLTLLQWETVITDHDTPILKQGPNLRCTKGCLEFSKNLGIDVYLLANNHTGDFGPEGIMETKRLIEESGSFTVGAGRNIQEACKPLFLTGPAGKIAIINAAENEFGMASEDEAGAAPYDLADCIELIRETKEKADLLIMTIHGGHEFNPFPSPRMVKSYRAFADAGADIVFNCHTHCAGGSEVRGETPIIYSPGNFYFPGSQYGHQGSWYFGYLPRFLCDSRGCYGYEIIPYVFTRSGIRLLDENEEKAMEKHYDFICSTIADKELLQKLFDAWCCGEMGHTYMEIINRTHEETFPPDWNDDGVVSRWIHVKNNFCCESHNDMLKRFSYLIANKRTKIEPEYTDLLQKTCKPDFMENWMNSQPEEELY